MVGGGACWVEEQVVVEVEVLGGRLTRESSAVEELSLQKRQVSLKRDKRRDVHRRNDTEPREQQRGAGAGESRSRQRAMFNRME